jgi:hypothetical protein
MAIKLPHSNTAHSIEQDSKVFSENKKWKMDPLGLGANSW